MRRQKDLNNMERKYVVFDVTEIEKIDFNEVMETSEETLRKSVDENLTFVKYEAAEMPTSVNSLETKQGPYSHYEFLYILDTEVWNNPNKEPMR
jgi:hypothetical protein